MNGLFMCNYCILTLTCAEGRFRPCLPTLQNPQQFSAELQNYTLHFTHTHRTQSNYSSFIADLHR